MTSMLKITTGFAAALALIASTGGGTRAQTSVAPPTVPLIDTTTAAPAPPPGLSEGVAAIVNDNVISTYDLSQRVKLLLISSGIRPTAENLPQIEREALNALINERLEVQEIKKAEKEQKFSIMADDKDVDHDLERIGQSSGMSAKQLLGALAASGVGASTLREQLRAQISWERWVQGRYGGSRMKISPEQVNAVFRQLEADTAKPQYQISEILIDANKAGGMDAAVAGAQQLIAQLQQGAPFPAVARQFSSASTAANGGEAGWLGVNQMPDGVGPVVEQMRPGSLSAPISVRDGVYIILLRNKREGAGSYLLSLKQAAVALPADAPADQVEAARTKLLALKSRITSCDTMEAEAAKVSGVISGDLGEAEPKDLAPSFREAAQGLSLNQVSDPLRTQAGLHLIALCGKRQAGVNLPSREEVENRLEDQQLSLVAKRYLRDLRSSATIETR